MAGMRSWARDVMEAKKSLNPLASMQLHYTAPEHVRECIAGLGRTEDIRFSPTNNRLAIAAFSKNTIAVFTILIDHMSSSPSINITDVVEIYSDYLNEPHGVDFIDDEKIIVANRGGANTRGNVVVFNLPSRKVRSNFLEL